MYIKLVLDIRGKIISYDKTMLRYARKPLGRLLIYVVVNILSQVVFDSLLFLAMVMYTNEVETKEK